MSTDFHCAKHHAFQPVCGGCATAKQAYWRAQVQKPDADDVPFVPVTPPPASPARARRTDPDTSHEAAETVNTGALEQAVVSAIRSFPDSSISDVVEYLGVDSNCISPRFAPLRRKGLIYSTGKKRSAKTGKQVLTWRAS